MMKILENFAAMVAIFSPEVWFNFHAIHQPQIFNQLFILKHRNEDSPTENSGLIFWQMPLQDFITL
tara:strand:+ start:176 stop:373 length:198 start_codon:yes stop_codon:yes gene_type:complete